GASLTGRAVELDGGAAVGGAQVMLAVTGTPQMTQTDAQGAFKVEGLPTGRPLQVTILADFSSYVPDHREITIPDGKEAHDLGTIRIIKGQMMQRMGATTGIQPMNRDGRAYVEKVTPDSSAAKAGLKGGEAITTIDGAD